MIMHVIVKSRICGAHCTLYWIHYSIGHSHTFCLSSLASGMSAEDMEKLSVEEAGASVGDAPMDFTPGACSPPARTRCAISHRHPSSVVPLAFSA